MICHHPSEQYPQPTHSKTRTKNAKIAVCVFPKSGTGIFSLWRVNFSLPAPKAKSFRAMFSATTSEKILARKPIGHGISCIRYFGAHSQSVRSSHLSASAFQVLILAKKPFRSSSHGQDPRVDRLFAGLQPSSSLFRSIIHARTVPSRK